MPNRILGSPAFQQQQQPPRHNSSSNNDGSMIELLARVPMNRGSLLKSIDNLLKTIETSENAVMIPTLLKDKVRVDAWELLLVAKILKASILGHGDLVEFYLNHIGHSSASLSSTVAQQQQQQQNGNSTTDFQLISPPVARAQFQQSPMGSPLAQTATTTKPILSTASSCSTSSSVHSASSSTTLNNSKSSSVSWMTANNNNQQANLSSSGASFSSVLSSTDVNTTSMDENLPEDPTTPTPASNGAVSQADASAEANRTLLAATSSARQAQPPSLLQLTTTNNHINSMMSDMFNQSGQLLSPSLEQLTTQLATFQQQNGNSPTGSNSALQFEAGALSISTSSPPTAATPTHLDLPQSSGVTPTAATPPPTRELRSSRSAGCLFRGANQSGASSPRMPHASAAGTPTTPASAGYPQAETLAQVGANGLVGDPSTLVKLLLQVEQLKSSIKHATVLLESVVELYKKSIDNIA